MNVYQYWIRREIRIIQGLTSGGLPPQALRSRSHPVTSFLSQPAGPRIEVFKRRRAAVEKPKVKKRESMNKKKTASGLKCLAGEVRRKKEEEKGSLGGMWPEVGSQAGLIRGRTLLECRPKNGDE